MLSSPNNFRPSTSLFHQFSLSSGPNNHGPKKKREAPIIPQYTPQLGRKHVRTAQYPISRTPHLLYTRETARPSRVTAPWLTQRNTGKPPTHRRVTAADRQPIDHEPDGHKN